MKQFNCSANVFVHVKGHTQERTFKCKYCHQSFFDSSTLKKHLRTHTGEKPYECKLCPKKFTQSGNLKRHLLVHEKYDPIQGNINNEKVDLSQASLKSQNQSNKENVYEFSKQQPNIPIFSQFQELPQINFYSNQSNVFYPY